MLPMPAKSTHQKVILLSELTVLDDSSDTRTAVSSLEVKVNGSVWDSNRILADGAAANATFTPSSTQSKGFILVCKGTIGLDSGGMKTNSVDEGKAIAAYHFQLLNNSFPA